MGLAGLLDQRVQVSRLKHVARQAGKLAEGVYGELNGSPGRDEASPGRVACVDLPQRGHNVEGVKPLSQPPGKDPARLGLRNGGKGGGCAEKSHCAGATRASGAG